MGHTEWAMWANEQGVISSVDANLLFYARILPLCASTEANKLGINAGTNVLLLGGILGTAAQFRKWYYAVYTLVLGILVLLIEYPRGKREKGKKTLERWHQKPFTHFVKCFGVLGRNYWFRFVFYILAAVPSFFFLSTILGGASLVFTSLIYLRAAISGETWKPCLPDEKTENPKKQQSDPPKQPPPRGPRSRSLDNLACEDSTGQNRV